jgi:small GTP-binding protein
LLNNIFLFKGKKFKDLEDLNIFCYPNEIIDINNKILVKDIIRSHGLQESKDTNKSKTSKYYKIEKPIAQNINDLNIFTSCVNGNIIIGLIFEKEDNPYDYRDIFEELLSESFNNGATLFFDEEIEIENLLISMFIDIRRYGDEIIDRSPEIEYNFQRESFFKVFLFGIDDVGKTSLVQKLKTGEFRENAFTPTRKFNIEHIQAEEKGLLSIWDMPGQKSFRSKWLKGLQDSNILIYMIDIANQRRFEESKKEFWEILNDGELNGIPLLILGNKSDLVNDMTDDNSSHFLNLRKEVCSYFNFERIGNRNWKFIFTSVKTNFNVESTVEMIFDLISN